MPATLARTRIQYNTMTPPSDLRHPAIDAMDDAFGHNDDFSIPQTQSAAGLGRPGTSSQSDLRLCKGRGILRPKGGLIGGKAEQTLVNP